MDGGFDYDHQHNQSDNETDLQTFGHHSFPSSMGYFVDDDSNDNYDFAGIGANSGTSMNNNGSRSLLASSMAMERRASTSPISSRRQGTVATRSAPIRMRAKQQPDCPTRIESEQTAVYRDYLMYARIMHGKNKQRKGTLHEDDNHEDGNHNQHHLHKNSGTSFSGLLAGGKEIQRHDSPKSPLDSSLLETIRAHVEPGSYNEKKSISIQAFSEPSVRYGRLLRPVNSNIKKNNGRHPMLPSRFVASTHDHLSAVDTILSQSSQVGSSSNNNSSSSNRSTDDHDDSEYNEHGDYDEDDHEDNIGGQEEEEEEEEEEEIFELDM